MSYQLIVNIQNFWHPGTGLGHGSHLDAITHRNAHQLPVLPGRTLKGIVRDAVTRWEGYKQQEKAKVKDKIEDHSDADTTMTIVDQLFGPHTDGKETWAGLLRFSDAGLLTEEANYLATRPDLLSGLYRTHFSTAIEHQTGVAIDKSLRGIELVVPLTLYATIDLVPNARYQASDLTTNWVDVVKPALSLIQAVGGHRTRGFGRATVQLEEK